MAQHIKKHTQIEKIYKPKQIYKLGPFIKNSKPNSYESKIIRKISGELIDLIRL